MTAYRKCLSAMPKDDLALELEKLQARFSWFQKADRSYRDPAETRRRLENDHKISLVRKEMARRKALADTINTALEEKRHDTEKDSTKES
jgi:hypothetical protein